MQALGPLQRAGRAPPLLPGFGHQPTGFTQGGIELDDIGQLVHTQLVLHRHHETGQGFTGLLANDGDADDAIAAVLGQHLDEPRIGTAKRARQGGEFEPRYLQLEALRPGLGFGQPHRGDLGSGEHRPRQHALTHRESLEVAEQGIHRGVPGLMLGHMGRALGAGNAAHRIDVRIAGREVFVDLQAAILRALQPERLEAQTGDIGALPQRQQNALEGQRLLGLVTGPADQPALAVSDFDTLRDQAKAQLDTVFAQCRGHRLDGLRVFLFEQRLPLADQGDAAAQAPERLRKFASTRTAAVHQQMGGPFAKFAEVVARQRLDRLETGNRGQSRAASHGDDDGARGQDASLHLHRPGRTQPGFAADHLDTEPFEFRYRYPLARAAGLALHTAHHLGEVERVGRTVDARLPRGPGESRRARQRTGQHTPLMHRRATQAATLDQTDLRLQRGGDTRRRQAPGATADHHQVALEALGPVPAAVGPPRLVGSQQARGHQREYRQQNQRADHGRGKNAGQRVDPDQLQAGVHVDRMPRQHAQLRRPPEGPEADPRQPKRGIQQHERNQGNQPQRDEVKAAVARQPLVDPGDLPPETALDPATQHEPADQHRHDGADVRGERHQHGAFDQAEQGTGQQRQHHGTGERQRGEQRVAGKEQAARPPGVRLNLRMQRAAVGLDRFQGEVLAEIEGEESGHRRRQNRQEQKPRRAHRAHSRAMAAPAPAFVRPSSGRRSRIRNG